MSLWEVVKEETHLTLIWHAQVSFVDGILTKQITPTQNGHAPPHIKSRKCCEFWQPLLCLDLVSFPVLNRLKLPAPLEVTEQPRGASPARAALHIPLSLPTTNLATSSSAMFTRTNGQEECVQYTCLKCETRHVSTSFWLDTHGFAHGPQHQTQCPRSKQFPESSPNQKKQKKACSGNFTWFQNWTQRQEPGNWYLLPYSVNKPWEKTVRTHFGQNSTTGWSRKEKVSTRLLEKWRTPLWFDSNRHNWHIHNTPFNATKTKPVHHHAQHTFLLSFVNAYSNSKTQNNLASLLPTQADPIIRFQKDLFECTNPDYIQRLFSPLSFASTSKRSGSQENLIDCRPRSTTCCDDV